MEMLILAVKLGWKYRNEVMIAIIALVVVIVIMDVKSKYKTVETQKTEIKSLQEGLENAQKAVKLQADIQVQNGNIDKQSFSNISGILHRSVPHTLIPGGVLGK